MSVLNHWSEKSFLAATLSVSTSSSSSRRRGSTSAPRMIRSFPVSPTSCGSPTSRPSQPATSPTGVRLVNAAVADAEREAAEAEQAAASSGGWWSRTTACLGAHERVRQAINRDPASHLRPPGELDARRPEGPLRADGRASRRAEPVRRAVSEQDEVRRRAGRGSVADAGGATGLPQTPRGGAPRPAARCVDRLRPTGAAAAHPSQRRAQAEPLACITARMVSVP